jgi:hypothetical protein
MAQELQLSTDQVLTSTVASTYQYDFQQTNFKAADGSPIYFHFLITTAVTGTAPTVTFAIQESADDTTYVTVLSTRALAGTELTKGTHFAIPMPVMPTPLRYWQAYYTASATVAAGKVTAWISNDPSIK